MTQPRRVAAVTIAERVSYELGGKKEGENLGEEVAYQVIKGEEERRGRGGEKGREY